MDDEILHEGDQFEKIIQDGQFKGIDMTKRIKKQEDHICSDMLTTYELTRLIGIRAATIDQKGVYYCDISNLAELERERLTAISLALLELQQKKCPLLIERRICPWTGETEIVNPNQMILPQRINTDIV